MLRISNSWLHLRKISTIVSKTCNQCLFGSVLSTYFKVLFDNVYNQIGLYKKEKKRNKSETSDDLQASLTF